MPLLVVHENQKKANPGTVKCPIYLAIWGLSQAKLGVEKLLLRELTRDNEKF
jgi:hypothetical protein